MKTATTRPSWSSAGAYRICVRGTLDSRWLDCLGGMSISTDESDNVELMTTLVGQLPDQAALIGVLNFLYDLHCSILLVERVKASEDTYEERKL